MFDGSQAQERFQGQVGTIAATPDTVDLFVGNATSGSFPMSVKSSLPLVGLQAEGFGMSVPDVRKDLPQKQDDPDDPSTASYKIPVTIKTRRLLDVYHGRDLRRHGPVPAVRLQRRRQVRLRQREGRLLDHQHGQ